METFFYLLVFAGNLLFKALKLSCRYSQVLHQLPKPAALTLSWSLFIVFPSRVKSS